MTRRPITPPADNMPLDPTLQHLLDVYGADQSRWPVEMARQFGAQFGALTGPAAEAAAMARRETVALDQVLSRASMVAATRQTALADRIMAEIGGTADKSNIVAMRPRTTNASTARHASPTLRPQAHHGSGWRVATALAAALVVGVGVGLSGSANTAFDAMAETVGVNLDRSVLAFNDEQGGAMAALDDEDVL